MCESVSECVGVCCVRTLMEQPMRLERFTFFFILSYSPSGVLVRSKLSVTPPVKSSRASDVFPPFRASYPPYSLQREGEGRRRRGR